MMTGAPQRLPSSSFSLYFSEQSVFLEITRINCLWAAIQSSKPYIARYSNHNLLPPQ
jgi:hypothetical protein